MPYLGPIHSAPVPGTAPTRPQINRARSSTGNNHTHLSRVFSAQYLDDVSIYHGGDKRHNDIGQHEFRVPLMIPGSLLVPIGLFIYGWTAQYKTHWIGPNIGAAIFAAGVIVGFQCIQTYLVDSYVRYAASAIGAATVLRSSAGFGFQLFAPYMYAALDYGWGNSLLGFIALGLGIPAPFLLWFFGKKLRERSTLAAGGGD